MRSIGWGFAKGSERSTENEKVYYEIDPANYDDNYTCTIGTIQYKPLKYSTAARQMFIQQSLKGKKLTKQINGTVRKQ